MKPLLLPCLLAMLWACGDKDADTGPIDGDAPDGGAADGGSDCTETGEELCDGIDNDCDGEIDEDAVDALDWYLDADGDGYGVESTILRACDRPDDGAELPYDCDDADPAIHPAADEVCDGIDNDCNIAVDDDAVDATAWYLDADGDGYGASGTALASCDALDGRVALDGDCDDEAPEVHPAADDRCDGIDNDCDGVIDGTCGEWSVAALGGESWWAHGGGPLAAGPIGDMDGDGIEDLYVSWASWGEEIGWFTSADSLLTPGPFIGDQVLDRGVHLTIHSAGYLRGGADVDGDGYDDLVYADFVSSGSRHADPTLSLVHGPIDLLRDTEVEPVSLLGPDASGAAAWAEGVGGWSKLAALRDFDGDGVGDLLWGAYRGVSLTLGPIVDGTESPGGVVSVDSHPGLSSQGVGDTTWLDDIDGDGLPEIALSWYDHAASHIFTSSGTTPSDLDTFSWDHRVLVTDARLRSAGDLDGDGRSDLAVTTPGNAGYSSSAGAVRVFLALDATDLEASDAACTITDDEAGALFGTDARGARDWDGDGRDDLAVTAPGSSAGESGAGFVAMYACTGPATLVRDDAVAFVEPTPESAAGRHGFGAALSGPADLDDDGVAAELVVESNPGTSFRYQDEGTGLLLYGTVVQPAD